MIGVLEALVFAIFAGFVGSILGLGGALILTPILVYFNIPIEYAIAASMVAIIATSSGAASSYVKEGLSNVRAAFYMEVFTAVGAIAGASFTGYIVLIHAQSLLYFIFAAFLGTSFLALGKMRNREFPDVEQDRLAKWLELEGSYYDKPAKKQIDYKLTEHYKFYREFLTRPDEFFTCNTL